MNARPIIVGVDGTDWSKAAVRWAAREAQRRGRPLRVTHVFDWEWHQARYTVSQDFLDDARKQAEGIVAGAVHEARAVAPDLPVDGDPVIGRHAATRLLAEAEGAELMVLGSRGRGGFASLLLGSVSQRVATHAPCPVVVVRGEGAEGPVVAGIDDSPIAEEVLAAAFDAAAAAGCGLQLVRSYLPMAALWIPDTVPVADPDEQRRMTEQVSPWREKYPAVAVEEVLTHLGIAGVLVEASRRARLVIVGSRGRGVLSGVALGSTGLQLLHHAESPVLIVR